MPPEWDPDEALERMRARQAQRKAAERAYAVPGLDVVWWSQTPPARVWTTCGVLCALAPGLMGMNGYVCLPPQHPWRQVALQNPGQDDPNPQVHGGITFGPHLTGWVGWDTAHGGDTWTAQALQACRPLVPPEVWQQWLHLSQLGLGPDLTAGMPWRREWTVEAVAAETGQLAAQVAQADPTVPAAQAAEAAALLAQGGPGQQG